MLNKKVCRISYCFAIDVELVRAFEQNTRCCLSLCFLNGIMSKIRIFSPDEFDRRFFCRKNPLLALCSLAVGHDEFQALLVRFTARNFPFPVDGIAVVRIVSVTIYNVLRKSTNKFSWFSGNRFCQERFTKKEDSAHHRRGAKSQGVYSALPVRRFRVPLIRPAGFFGI